MSCFQNMYDEDALYWDMALKKIAVKRYRILFSPKFGRLLAKRSDGFFQWHTYPIPETGPMSMKGSGGFCLQQN